MNVRSPAITTIGSITAYHVRLPSLAEYEHRDSDTDSRDYVTSTKMSDSTCNEVARDRLPGVYHRD